MARKSKAETAPESNGLADAVVAEFADRMDAAGGDPQAALDQLEAEQAGAPPAEAGAPPAEPVSPPPSDAEAALRKIAEAQQAVSDAKDKMDAAKERAKMAREAWEFRVEELGRIIRQATEPERPMFGGPLESAGKAPATAEPDGDGRSATVEALGLSPTITAILRGAGLWTVGQIGDCCAGGRPLTAIEAEVDGQVKRITESRAEAILAALERHWERFGAKAPAEAAEATEPEEPWRRVLTTDLPIRDEWIDALVTGAGLATLGQLDDRIRSIQSLDEIDGIDSDAAGEIAQALDDYRAALTPA